MIFYYLICHNTLMKKMMILLTLLIPVASWGHPIDTWIDKIIEYETANKRTNPALINAYAVNQEKLDMTDCMEEYMILGLRRMCGVSKEDFLHRFGKPIESVYGEELLQLEKEGLLSVAGDRIALTEFGIDVSNRVFVEFLKK